MSTLLTTLLQEHDAEKRSRILEELLKKRADPDDPLYELLSLFGLTLKTHEQMALIGQQIPAQLREAMEEFDQRLDAHVATWRTLSGEIAPAIKAALDLAMPELRSQLDAIRKGVESNAKAPTSGITAPERREGTDVKAQGAAKVDILRAGVYAQVTTAVVCGVLFLAGLLGGFGIRTAYPQYSPQTSRDIEYGRQYQAMYAHMPHEMKVWIAAWMSAR